MHSYHNDQKVKDKYVLRMQKHIEMDELVQGTGWDIYDTKGCAVGCTLNSYDHDGYVTELGLPIWLAHLEDNLHEGVSQEYAKTFALNFLQAIPLGLSDSDFNKINAKFLILIMQDNLVLIGKSDITDKLKKQMIDVINQCLDLQEKIAISGEIDKAAEREIEAAEREIGEIGEISVPRAAKAAAWAVGAAAWASMGAQGLRVPGAPPRAVAEAELAVAEAAWAVGETAWAVGETVRAAREVIHERYADHLIKLLAEKKK